MIGQIDHVASHAGSIAGDIGSLDNRRALLSASLFHGYVPPITQYDTRYFVTYKIDRPGGARGPALETNPAGPGLPEEHADELRVGINDARETFRKR
ncbi:MULTISPECIES: hypothetical protein [unclassified Bradyrhizobium]|uniref:hypothetical protein n=1 Tax=unclassified Bradyrhizobium TaxID=2631580 RepID=UPI002478820A|nr:MULTISPECIES: hypothetical protein [unclassified Bradyrhizobium]WGR75355.1 hypothetical protein MTX24_31190 [Bradyrhizobium sp. ISRA426]WGR90557.1 hypothetical protein MTX25_30865 [Bradyrhizobium sp. ISRA432]